MLKGNRAVNKENLADLRQYHPGGCGPCTVGLRRCSGCSYGDVSKCVLFFFALLNVFGAPCGWCCICPVCYGGIDLMTFPFSIVRLQSGIKASCLAGRLKRACATCWGGEMRLCETSGPLECQTRRGGTPAHERHISSRSSHLSAGVQGLSVHVLDECLRPHRVLVSVFGTTTVLLTTFCSLLIWFSPRLALFHAALFALYFRILLLKLFLSSCLFCLPVPLLLFFPHFHPVLF